ncbi:MAG: guanylate kinase [Hyphomicrobiales bacterium]|nr:MAG: guanylate kinase [Hyphomicrobiales bacterium]
MTEDISDKIERRGVMLVLSSPSGAGKSTIARTILANEPRLEMSVSVTTRERRGSEIDGQHYHFISRSQFERLEQTDALLESAEVHGNFYGTPRDAVSEALTSGKDMLFDIDYQGALQLMEKAPADVVSIFILPPTMVELESRLHRRAEDTDEVIVHRLENAKIEIPHWREYDYVIINHDLDRAYNEVRSILTAERLRRDRRPGLFPFEEQLLG